MNTNKTVVVLSAFLLLAPAVFSIGISPPRFVLEVLPGSFLEETVLINVLEADSKVIYVSLEGEAGSWIQHPSQLLVPDSREKVVSTFSVHVPSETPLGNYSARIDYLFLGEKNVDLAFSVPVQFVVTDTARVQYALRDLQAAQAGNLSFSFTLYNKGTANFGPTGAAIVVMDNLRKNTIYKGKKNINAVRSFATKFIELDFGIALPNGNYWIDFSVPSYNYEETIFLEVNQAVEAQSNLPTRDYGDAFIAVLFIAFTVALIGFVSRAKMIKQE